MAVVLSIILLIAFILISIKILKGDYENLRLLPVSDDTDVYYEMNPLMFYLIFVIITAPIFLVPPFSLAKYAVYFATLVILLRKGRIEKTRSEIVTAYWIFYIWLIFSGIRSSHYIEAITLLIKYIIPIFSLYLGYSALERKVDIYHLIKFVLIGIIIYTFLIGGLSAKFYSWFYFSPIGNQFLKYAGFADYLTSLFILPFIMVWITGRKKWYWVGALMLLSTILEAVRTGLGGMFIVMAIYLFYRFKWKSLPFIGAIVAVLIAVILYVPNVNQKFFGENAGKVTADAIIEQNAMSLDKIQDNGREYAWSIVMNNCYDGHEIIGSGLGASGSYLKYFKENITDMKNMAVLLHNDYVQILGDTGLIGLILLISFFFILVCSVTFKIWNCDDFAVKITGIMVIASASGVAFSMGFDNVVSHSMTSLIIPFIFTGLYLKTVELSEYGEIPE